MSAIDKLSSQDPTTAVSLLEKGEEVLNIRMFIYKKHPTNKKMSEHAARGKIWAKFSAERFVLSLLRGQLIYVVLGYKMATSIYKLVFF